MSADRPEPKGRMGARKDRKKESEKESQAGKSGLGIEVKKMVTLRPPRSQFLTPVFKIQ
jgi:hypothetical protein